MHDFFLGRHDPLCILSSFPPSRMRLSPVNDITASIKECIIKPVIPEKYLDK